MQTTENVNEYTYFLSTEELDLEFHEAFTEVSYLGMLKKFSSIKAFVYFSYISCNMN